MSGNDRKFSVLAKLGGEAEGQLVADLPGNMPDGASSERSFKQIVEETRSYLIGYEGIHDREKQRHHELLNRAVLGYAEERRLLLAMVQDFLLKKRLFVEQSPDGRFATLTEAVFSEIIGLNVLELIMNDKEGLEEIQVIGTRIYEVRAGVSKPSVYSFRSVGEVERIQQNLVLFNQDTLHVRKRWAEVRLSDGARATLTGFGYTSEPTLTIRFYTSRIRTLEVLCDPRYSTLDEYGMLLLRALARSYVNLVVIGPTNSGKTQLLKTLVGEMPDDERLVTIESRFELMLGRDYPNKNIVQYEVAEDDPQHDGHQAFKLALRQSPKRICHAEIRDEDANLYVKACTRGHDGSMTTLHASSLEDVPETIADMCMMDSRPMNPDRLVKRIAQRVAQVGIEMATINGFRKVARIGEFQYQSGHVVVRTLLIYDDARQIWHKPDAPSFELSARIKRFDPATHLMLEKCGMAEIC